ncbi:DNA polymerase III, beta subunit [Propionibacterium sp. oral taxon 192 str. F0372]|uniref:DNA polymerase III subunit beta n=1 Tax=Propionibacterium sp. oral taxon 192 TaxID=671222 RepID=UPI0003537C23|nr:DNA polymerase III subunit beta [Propionibacterium sp. oral taxon 192]EPH06240.1 DNA polymerase III, beta subunit [Propionibacterium sp. oral taxon 192 str. F0372]
MKIRLERDAMAEAVAWAARSLPSRPSVPILAGLLIKADANGVTMSSFDYETSAQVQVTAHVVDEGEVLVSGRLLADIAKSLPAKPVEFTADASRAELVCGSARFTLQTLPVEDYPELPEMPSATGEIGSGDFAQAISQVVVAAGRDELLPVFTGVRVEIEGERISLLATDRYRMALKELVWKPGSTSTRGAALVPARVLSEAARSMASGEVISVALSNPDVGEGLIGLEGHGNGASRQLTTRLLGGEFPKVRHIMDIQPTLTVRCRTDELVASVKRVALVAERNSPLRMLIGDDQIALEAASGEQAQASEAVAAEVTNIAGGEPALSAAGFNPHYLVDALGAVGTPWVHFSFTAAGKPCLVQGVNDADAEPDTDYKHVIMLMRLPS